MCNIDHQQPNKFKRGFARFLADFEEEGFELHKERKSRLYANLSGKVLEIGPGTGANFPFLNAKVIDWIGLEPNIAMLEYLRQRAGQFGFEPTILVGKTEAIPLEDESIDYVISAEVLCSVVSLKQSLKEIKRVLKPGGKFVFLEHVVDQHNFFRRAVQYTVPFTPWAWYSDGCHPHRDIGKSIAKAGFVHVEMEQYQQDGRGIIANINRPHIMGEATK